MTRFIVAIAAAVMIQMTLVGGLHAEASSPLDRPIEEIQKNIAAIARCKWSLAAPLVHTCDDPQGNSWIHIVMAPDGKIDHLWFLPLTYEVVGVDRERDEAIYEATERARAEQAIVIAIIKKLWPSWTNSRQWLTSAFKKTNKKRAQDSIRVGDTSAYVSESMYVNSDNHNGFLAITKKTDLTELKIAECEDDEQGPGLDSCTERDGPRPPENPILHPK